MAEALAPQRSFFNTFGEVIKDQECISRSVVVVKKTFSAILSLDASGIIALSQESISKISGLTKCLSGASDVFVVLQLPQEGFRLGKVFTRIYRGEDDPALLQELKMKFIKKSLRIYLTSAKVAFIFQGFCLLQLSLRLQKIFVSSSPFLSIVLSILDAKKGWQDRLSLGLEEQTEKTEIKKFLNKVFLTKAVLSLIASAACVIAFVSGNNTLTQNLFYMSFLLSVISYVKQLLSIYLKASSIHYKDALVNA